MLGEKKLCEKQITCNRTCWQLLKLVVTDANQRINS